MTDIAASRAPSLIDPVFLYRWSPARFMALGMIIYATVLVAAPLQYDYSVVSLEGALYAAGTYLAFFAGCRIARFGNPAGLAQSTDISARTWDKLITITLLIGTVGVVARLYDRVVLRGFTVGETYLETRESLSETVSIFGYIGGFGFSFGIVALCLLWLSKSARRRPVATVLAIMLALYPAAEALAQGSRSTLLHTGFLLVFFARSTNTLSFVFRSKWIMLGLLVAFAVFAQIIYEVRSLENAEAGVDIAEVYRQAGLARFSAPQSWVTDILIESEGHGLLASLLKVVTHTAQYMTHSWFVYFVNYDGFEGVYGWGGVHFNVPVRVLSAITGIDLIYDPARYGMQAGFSSTVMSLIYYDFGAMGPVVAALFGYLVTIVHRKAIEMPARWLPLHSYLCFACLTAQIDNQLTGGLGVFASWSFLLYAALHYFLSLLSDEPNAQTAAMQQP
jgi:hypothetical protein